MLFPFHKPKARTPEEESLALRVDGELNRLFIAQAYTSSLTGLLSALVLAVMVLPHHIDDLRVIVWSSGMVALYLLRFFWLGSRLRKGPDTCRSSAIRRSILLFIGLMGFCWGAAAAFFVWHGEVVTQVPLLMILLGLLTLTPPILSARPLASYLFTFPVLAGCLARIWVGPPSIFIQDTVIALLLAAFTIGITHRFNSVLVKGITQRLEKESIFDRLVEAKLRAEANASAKGNFIATMSHEIRTPVNGLMGMLEILKDTELSTQQANYLNTASRSAESLLQLLNDILDYSKIEVGKLELDKVPFDWVAMTGEIAMMNRVLASDKGISFHLEIPPEPTSIVVGDPVRLRQILNNLLSNAMKFTSEGTIWLKVHIDNEDTRMVRLSFTVKDTGIGIEPEVQKRLFQKYQQASASTGTRYGGSGLGLAISQQLALLMGGAIRLESTPGKGSEFTLSAPFPKATPETLQSFIAASGIPQRFRARVLVVEDDPVSQRVAVLMLKSFGITPTVVNSGGAAIERAQNEPFDLIFMDSRLPDMDGFSAASIILTTDPSKLPGPKPVIVAMTGADSPDDRQRARESGITEYIAKPVRKRDIRTSLEKWAAKTAQQKFSADKAAKTPAPFPAAAPEAAAASLPLPSAPSAKVSVPSPDKAVPAEAPKPEIPAAPAEKPAETAPKSDTPAPASLPASESAPAASKAAEAPLPEKPGAAPAKAGPPKGPKSYKSRKK